MYIYLYLYTKKLKADKEALKAKAKKIKDNFFEMLKESEHVDSSSRWANVLHHFTNDSRNKMVETERERSELFYEYVDDVSKREKIDLEKAKC